MSAYGPVVFVSRKDGADLSEEEQATVFRLVQDACLSLKMTDDHGDPVRPSNRGYHQDEEKALGILVYYSYAWADMPEELKTDEAADWTRYGARVSHKVEQQAPGVYAFTSYGLEV
ncbi:hypothetical protein [Streptomyces griseiscabiei]|uniref:Uncharacterized protein n=1 Tax=Streptomyces griseiscabiei TaxID=2993540 RepID=A0ABU4L1Z7_9ACTN|nr:hypothetical protein [Streptomyces griseiscabiei]MBZ3906058.1 hypothetical protein [Streptomyces griseiscabiei]MDX2909692.1 hypothetical protein [Streptomyces griseiscabiei]